jgi:diaminopimelate epimerase
MKVEFVKMQGCGNDYIYFNCLKFPFPNPEINAVKFSDRHFGIGGDGIILIEHSDRADAFMRLYNADGSAARMCGNGIRSVAKYLRDAGLLANPAEAKIDTPSGVKFITFENDNITVNMGRPGFEPDEIPMCVPFEMIHGNQNTIIVDGEVYYFVGVSMGNPHAVVFVYDPYCLDLNRIGPIFEKHDYFPESVNTEFVRVLTPNEVTMRVWERGSGETLACGTGACAASVAAARIGYCDVDNGVTVHLRGGDLFIRTLNGDVFMTGTAEKVFEGVIDID